MKKNNNEKIKKDNFIILLSKEKNFLLKKTKKVVQTSMGFIDIDRIKHYGQKIKSSTGHEFIAARPSFIDILRKCKRGPQIIMPKDAVHIIAVTGLTRGWNCLDAGSGSGFLAVFLGNVVSPGGSVVTYEKEKKFADNVKNNVELCGLGKIVKVINKDAKKFSESEMDLITLDMKYAEKMVKKCWKTLNHGGWLCVYSPHIEQQKEVMKEMKKLDFTQIQTIENIQRSWQVSDFTHPRPSGILHTGFMTFARKI